MVPGGSLQMPTSRSAWIIVISTAEPSTIAASTTWPSPEERASRIAQTTPKANIMPPPP